MIKGKQREDLGFSKKVGIFEAEVIAINPNLDELKAIYGENSAREEEPEYLKEKEVEIDGEKQFVDALRILVMFKDKKTKAILNGAFYLENRERVNKDGTKKQYLNKKGTTTWATSEDELPTWFTKDTEYRVARVGEDELYNFVNKWSNFDFKDPEFEIDLEFDKLITGDVSELKALVQQNKGRTITGLATIKTKEVDQEEKTFQGVYTKNFLPGWTAKLFRTKTITDEVIEELREKAEARKMDKNAEKLKPFEQFIVEVSDPEHGVKDFYKFTELSNYNPEENITESNTVHSTDGSDY